MDNAINNKPNLAQRRHFQHFILFQEDEDDLDSEEDEEDQQRSNEKSTSPTDWQKAGKVSFIIFICRER